LLFTGSLDGQIQAWDTRHCSLKTPANLKWTVSTPFSIRRIQWPLIKSDNLNQLAVQCDRCIRVYDVRRTDSYLSLSNDLEHTQRIISMDWTMQSHSIATLSLDNSFKIFSTNGQVLAESLPNEQSTYTFNKV
jgi:WD40 repeat protein